MAKKYYVVWFGRKPGIYENWSDCEEQIRGFEGARFRAFPDLESAKEALEYHPDHFKGKVIRPTLTKDVIALVGKPDPESISVDAACSGNPGDMEYRGVDTKSGIELFRAGVFAEATVNIGEFLAVVHALAMLVKQGRNVPIYSDSKTAIKWIRDKRTKTKLVQTPANGKVFELIKRAETWLKENDYPNEIRKWETKYWGEIPADFGRK